MNALSRNDYRLRIVSLGVLAATALTLRVIDPAAVWWWRLRSSCGAITGLPCIFCGTTRALHQLLNGKFAQALYFNWLSFVVAAAAVALAVAFGAELLLRRRLLFASKIRWTPRLVAAAAAALVVLWIFQVSLAIGFEKRELLNPHAIFPALV